jgi:hypothetical protein
MAWRKTGIKMLIVSWPINEGQCSYREHVLRIRSTRPFDVQTQCFVFNAEAVIGYHSVRHDMDVSIHVADSKSVSCMGNWCRNAMYARNSALTENGHKCEIRFLLPSPSTIDHP